MLHSCRTCTVRTLLMYYDENYILENRMKEIQLPITQTISMPLKADLSKAVDLGNGNFRIDIGEVSSNDYAPLIETARRNGGNILYATTSIEQQLEYILMEYFMGPFIKHEERRVLFEREILQSTALGYRAKKELISTIVKHNHLLDTKTLSSLQKRLKQVMDWRNAFAHGKLIYDTVAGCSLRYYSGGAKSQPLTDEYWTEVENGFKECIELLKAVQNELYRIQTTSDS